MYIDPKRVGEAARILHAMVKPSFVTKSGGRVYHHYAWVWEDCMEYHLRTISQYVAIITHEEGENIRYLTYDTETFSTWMKWFLQNDLN